MAEARGAVSFLDIHDVSEGKDTWQDTLCEIRKGVKRRYYRTCNSIRNGMWPTSIYNVALALFISMIIMYTNFNIMTVMREDLWFFVNWIKMPQGTPVFFHALLGMSLVAVAFFLILMFIRRQLLRLLLRYHGWMYEPPRRQSRLTVAWSVLVKIISGYHPSLYSCQRSLPTMSVPPLKHTISTVLQSLKPLLSAEEYRDLEQEAKEFETGLGPKLNNQLVLKSWWAQNYVSDWWEKYVYLMSRSPLVINSNYYILGYSYYTPTNNQLARASYVVTKLLEFKRLVDREQMPPLLIRGTIPLCMAQYERMYSTTRIPRPEIDKLHHWSSQHSKHLCVFSKGIYYKLDMFDNTGHPLTPRILEQQLKWIKDDSARLSKECEEEEKSIACLTTLPRNEWAEHYLRDFTTGVNRESMDIIDKAMFIVVLSDYIPKDTSDKANFMLRGDGTCLWFDKSFNFVIFADGQTGANAEHSLADAPILGHMYEYMCSHELLDDPYCDCGRLLVHSRLTQASVKTPQPLQWEVSPQLKLAIPRTLQSFKKNSDDLDLIIVDHSAYGKGLIKLCKVSPDAYIQLALQLAYYKDASKFALTYEASMTRLYLGGRTETVRSLTEDSVNFVKAMLPSSGASTEDRVRLLKKAATSHQKLYRDAMNGVGVDRHIFCLYVVCKGKGYESDFLKNVLSKPWTLSTSQQPQQQMESMPSANLPRFKDKVSPGGGFGPVSDEGYGVSYMLPRDDKIFFHISAKKSCLNTDATRFADNIFTALDEMRNLFNLDKSNGID